MLNPIITIKHNKIYLSCSNVNGVQVEPKHKLSRRIHYSDMKYTRKYNKNFNSFCCHWLRGSLAFFALFFFLFFYQNFILFGLSVDLRSLISFDEFFFF